MSSGIRQRCERENTHRRGRRGSAAVKPTQRPPRILCALCGKAFSLILFRHRDMAADPIRPRQLDMRRGPGGDPFAQPGRERADPPRPHVDVQEHQLLRRGALAGGAAEHLVAEMEALVVRAEDLRRHPHPLANQQLAFIAVVRLCDKGALLLDPAVVEAEAELAEQEVGRAIEQHDVIGQIQMAVPVDPLGQHLALESLVRRRDGHRDILSSQPHGFSSDCRAAARAGPAPIASIRRFRYTPPRVKPRGPARWRRFSDMEVFVEIQENVRGEDVFVIQSTSYPANDHLMELLVSLDALRRSSARRITAVVPYYGYARQDRKSSPRTPISAKLVANMITAAGADRVLTLDLHAGQIQGFFDIPTDNLYPKPVLVKDIQENHAGKDLVIVSPDVGGVFRARQIARRLDADLAIVDKRRERAGVSEVMNIIGDVAGRRCILVDDIVDSAGTLCNAAQALMDNGAEGVYAYVSHGVLSGGAVARVAASPIKMLVLTDSIVATEAVRLTHNVRQLTIAPLMAEAILRISEERSVSSLFD